MIPKNKIEEAARKYSETQCQNLQTVIYTREELEDYCYQDFLVGYSFAEKELENLAIEFANYLFLYRQNSLGEWKHQNRNKIVKTTKELFEIFKQEKYEHEH